MTTIKITDKAHKELKIISAKIEQNMIVIATEAILQYAKQLKSKK